MRATSKKPRAATAIKKSENRIPPLEPFSPNQRAYVDGAIDAARKQERARVTDRLAELQNDLGEAEALVTATSSIMGSARKPNLTPVRHLVAYALEAMGGCHDLIDSLVELVNS